MNISLQIVYPLSIFSLGVVFLSHIYYQGTLCVAGNYFIYSVFA